MQFLKRHRSWLRLLGVLLLVAIVPLFRINLSETAAIIARANLLDIVLAAALFVPFLAAKAWRWQVILRDLGVRIAFGEALTLYALGLGAGMVTPGQVGDAVKVAYFRERGLGRALVSVLLDRLWDILVLLMLTGSGAFLFWQALQSEWILLALLTLGTVVVLALTASPRAQVWLLNWLQRIRPGANGGVPFEPVGLTPWQILRQFGLTLLATVVVYLRLYLLTVAVGVQLAPVPFVAVMSLATVAALVPVSISGVGTRDAALVAVSGLVGMSPEQALSISALILFLSVVNGLVGLGVWLLWKRGDAERLKDTREQSAIRN